MDNIDFLKTKMRRDLESLSPDLARRSFPKVVSAAGLSVGCLGRSQAAETQAPPKPRNVLSPNDALKRLMEGNDRFVEGKMQPHDFISERAELALAQNPFAVIVGCSDSRVAPEIAAVLKDIEPAVQEAKGKPGDPIENAVRAQAVQVARQLQSAGPILVERVRSGQLKIVAAREDLDTGKVELLSI
jgi:hypothetical protein